MSTVKLKYRGHEVLVKTPSRGIEGKYTVSVGTLVTAHPTVKEHPGGKRIRIYWDKDYGKRFNRLLQGSFSQFFREIGAAA